MKPEIKKAFISFRIGPGQWMPNERFVELLSLFNKYRGVTDEITFFTADTHAPLPVDVTAKRASLLAVRMAKVREMGYSTGINVLTTIGHHNENLENSLAGEYTHMTDIDGNACLGSYCPNDPNFREYVRRIYESISSAGPDYIWIDDDVRLAGHMPITCGCFCDTCLSIFEKETGKRHTRESLKNAFNDGELGDKLAVRKAWLEHNRNTISRLFKLIEATVHEIKPGLPLGFMTGDRFFEGYDFSRWAEDLAGSDNAEVMWRPGGGFYGDWCPGELIGKSHGIGRQVSMLPEGVFRIESEIESFPYQRLMKSSHMTALEAASYIAAGCTGMAFNVLPLHDEPLTEYKPLIAKLHAMRPFYDLMAKTLGRHHPQGVYTGWNKDTFAVGNISQGDWLTGEVGSIVSSHASQVFDIGVPAAYSQADSSVTLLSGDSILAMSEDELLKVFSSGVYMDANALARLHEMGHGELAGFSMDAFHNEDCIEVLTEHHINSGFAGRRRDCRQSFLFWHVPAAALAPIDSDGQLLARLVDYGDRNVAECCMGLYENKLGGRVCVAGYYPWTFLQNLSKASQIKSIMRWLSKESLPCYVESFQKVNMWCRELEFGKLSLVLLNASLDNAEDVVLMLRTKKTELSAYDMNCEEITIHASGRDGSYNKFILPSVRPWEIRLLLV